MIDTIKHLASAAPEEVQVHLQKMGSDGAVVSGLVSVQYRFRSAPADASGWLCPGESSETRGETHRSVGAPWADQWPHQGPSWPSPLASWWWVCFNQNFWSALLKGAVAKGHSLCRSVCPSLCHTDDTTVQDIESYFRTYVYVEVMSVASWCQIS